MRTLDLILSGTDVQAAAVHQDKRSVLPSRLRGLLFPLWLGKPCCCLSDSRSLTNVSACMSLVTSVFEFSSFTAYEGTGTNSSHSQDPCWVKPNTANLSAWHAVKPTVGWGKWAEACHGLRQSRVLRCWPAV